MRFLYIFKLIVFLLTAHACGGNNNSQKKQEQIQLLIYLQNNSNPTSTTQAACFNFASTENTCIIVSDNQTTTCSDSELTHLKNGIQPSTQRTDSTLIAFFGCWKSCALLFNTTNSICNGAKYPTTKTYRDAQKSTTNTASTAWGACMTKCNNGESEETGLKGTGATYPTQPF
jgi:hypothetical protein